MAYVRNVVVGIEETSTIFFEQPVFPAANHLERMLIAQTQVWPNALSPLRQSTRLGQRALRAGRKSEHEIRITVRETDVHEMGDGIEEEMVEGLGETALTMGADGRVSNSRWATLADSRALQIDMESKQSKRFARTVKAKHNNWDHFLGIYVSPSDQQDELCELFAEFLARYR